MKLVKFLAAAAIVSALFAAPATAEARTVKKGIENQMQKEYGFQKDYKNNKVIKKKKKSAKKKMHKKYHGTYPNNCIKPPCGYNYNN